MHWFSMTTTSARTFLTSHPHTRSPTQEILRHVRELARKVKAEPLVAK